MKLQQTQLMLIVDNVGLPTPGKTTVYDEVMDIWIKTMVMADNLISGMAQSVQSADDLLGLCAWHICPDIFALGVKPTTIEQRDRLVMKGGLLTIGLRNSREHGLTGVSWSMPLAHLRFYGKPVISHATIGSTSSRVPFYRGMHVVLGSLASEWQSSFVNPAKLARFLVLFAETLEAGMEKVLNERSVTPYQNFTNVRKLTEKYRTFADIGSDACWPSILSLQAQAYLNSNESEQTETDRYLALGRRRYGRALDRAEDHPSPHFGLSETGIYLRLTAPMKRVSKLREMAKVFGGEYYLGRAIIRLTHPKDALGYQLTEFATLFPQAVEGTLYKTHRRWIVFPKTDNSSPGNSSAHFTELQMKAIQRSIFIMRYDKEPCGFLHPDALTPNSHETWSTPREISHDRDASTLAYPPQFNWTSWKLPSSSPLSIPHLADHTAWAEDLLPAKQRIQGWQMGHSTHTYGVMNYSYLYGDNAKAAVYQPTIGVERRGYDYALPADFVIRALENGDLDSVRFVDHFLPLFLPQLLHAKTSDYFSSLVSFAHANQLYATLPQAEISLTVFEKSMCLSNWARALLTGTHETFTRPISLACASLFDTGYLDLHIDDLQDVLAIASGNSIYASDFLFRDPSHPQPKHHLRHVIGNVGKPGLALLLSPRDTNLREPDLETWQLVNHAKFDGRFEDNFASTTLHLSLTGYEQRLNTSRYGRRDKEAFYLEAVVSAYDKGIWVADLDPLHLIHGRFLRLDSTCRHDASAQQDFSHFPGLTSVDNWYEYLDRPLNMAIIRASGNWMARLALAAIPLASKEDLIIATDRMCWACLMDKLKLQNLQREEWLVLC